MDLTEAATPAYFATMGLEHQVLKRRARRIGPTPADYERNDTRTSLAMGTLSLIVPILAAKVLAPFAPGKGRFGKVLVRTALGAAAVTTVADIIARRTAATVAGGPEPSERRRRWHQGARAVAAVGAPVAVAAGGVSITTAWWSRLDMTRMWDRRVGPDLGTGPMARAAAIAGWDFIYYWNHRFMHTSRYMWAIHVVHHSSERYNLSTALRQPVADALGTFVPYGVLCRLGIRPELIQTARGVNLIYQYWIHTDTIRSLGPAERIFNTASHHRVHHGSNPEYLDRNHGSILIIWDKLFGTFEPERAPVVYGLTKNIKTYNPAKVAFHEHLDILRDVSRATTWRDRINFVVRGPGWAYARHRADAADAVPPAAAAATG